mgnify:CR=1 FL=1
MEIVLLSSVLKMEVNFPHYNPFVSKDELKSSFFWQIFGGVALNHKPRSPAGAHTRRDVWRGEKNVLSLTLTSR